MTSSEREFNFTFEFHKLKHLFHHIHYAGSTMKRGYT